MGRIFISYRRTDSADQAGRVFDRLVAAFSKASVFKDVDSVPPGADFRRVIEQSVMKSDTFVLVIGPSWLNVENESGRRRLDDANDFVRLELETALRLEKLIIPVLVRGGVMPRPSELPAPIREVAYRNAVSVRADPDFHRDMDRLIQAIKSSKAEKYSTTSSPQAKPDRSPQSRPPRKALYGLAALVLAIPCLFFAFSSIGPKPIVPDQPRMPAPPTDDGSLNKVAPQVPAKVMPMPAMPSKIMPMAFVPALEMVNYQGPGVLRESKTGQSDPPRPSPQGPIGPMLAPSGDPVPTTPPPSAPAPSAPPPSAPPSGDCAPPGPSVPAPTTPPASTAVQS